MALRLLHLADVHFGMENYGRLDAATGLNRRLLDFVVQVEEQYLRIKSATPSGSSRTEWTHKVFIDTRSSLCASTLTIRSATHI